MNKTLIIIIFAFLLPYTLHTRSPFRKKDPTIPEITIGWKNSKRTIKRSNWAYTEYPMFTAFNKDFFYNNLLPSWHITSTHEQSQYIDCRTLNKQIEVLLTEIKKQKKEYTHFTILQNKNFNHRKKCGLIVLKFKDFPLVLKLFMETPNTFINPYCKGFENQFFFYMSGGINRHISGLTRIKNLTLVKEQINNHPKWQSIVKTPRKWYWLPQKLKWIEIKGKNIGDKKEIITHIPGTYAIIADEIDTHEDAPDLSSQEKSEMIMELCMDLHLFVDPHADNFVIKYKPDTKNYVISIVDTEHFPSMVGLKEEPFFNNHLEWYLYLGAKFFQDAFLQTKQDRKDAQKKYSPCALRW